MSESQLDLFQTAPDLRDQALTTVAHNAGDWMDEAHDALRRLSPWQEYTGEDIRLQVDALIGAPHHHNAWGAVIREAIRRGTLKFTGRYRNMKTPKSHARRTPIYTRR